MDVDQRCKAIELILCDVDGVMTDGRLVHDDQGVESKAFHIRDGQGIRLWRKAGYPFGMITLRTSRVVQIRAAELEIDILRQGVGEKLEVIKDICGELDIESRQVCYLGDDLPDVPALRHVGLGVAVADACEETRRAAHHVTTLPGGTGAVRETIEMILKSQGRWEELIRDYLS
ncbi:MAG TPA: phenylphosphate carboxylase subunit delta [Planctomycetaceae bacterium]|nr:phenylphosphate carboxylase subunit delta [Planctomycetaceae bacterium]